MSYQRRWEYLFRAVRGQAPYEVYVQKAAFLKSSSLREVE